jgi:hypothetical protein
MRSRMKMYLKSINTIVTMIFYNFIFFLHFFAFVPQLTNDFWPKPRPNPNSNIQTRSTLNQIKQTKSSKTTQNQLIRRGIGFGLVTLLVFFFETCYKSMGKRDKRVMCSKCEKFMRKDHLSRHQKSNRCSKN